jgi:hypothetical protein
MHVADGSIEAPSAGTRGNETRKVLAAVAGLFAAATLLSMVVSNSSKTDLLLSRTTMLPVVVTTSKMQPGSACGVCAPACSSSCGGQASLQWYTRSGVVQPAQPTKEDLSTWTDLLQRMTRELSTDTMEVANLKNQVAIDNANTKLLTRKYDAILTLETQKGERRGLYF